MMKFFKLFYENLIGMRELLWLTAGIPVGLTIMMLMLSSKYERVPTILELSIVGWVYVAGIGIEIIAITFVTISEIIMEYRWYLKEKKSKLDVHYECVIDDKGEVYVVREKRKK